MGTNLLRFVSFVALSLLSTYGTCSDVTITAPQGKVEPWFTGPLITPSAVVVAPGKVNLEPYVYWTVINGKYGKDWGATSVPQFYQLNPLLFYRFGLTKNLDFGGIIQGFYNHTEGQSKAVFGDLPVTVDYQLYRSSQKDNPYYLLLALQETFPTGKYRKLDPDKLGTDIGGQGAYLTQIRLVGSKVYQFQGPHFLRLRAFVGVTFPSSVHVKGVNAYGGDVKTHGKVHPGKSLIFTTSGEYTLTQNWVLACDFVAQWSARSRFKGHTITAVGSPSSAQLSLAPAIEYNWNENIGLIVGSWFTFAGRNSSRFYNVTAALDIYF